MTETDIPFVTLVRDRPWRAQIAITAFLALLFGSIGGSMLYATHNYDNGWSWGDDWLVLVSGIVFSSLGALMALLTVHQMLAVRTPECTVAISPAELARAGTVQLRVRQPGPVRLRSLHARLLCEVSTQETSESGKTYWSTHYPVDQRVVTCDTPQDVQAGGVFENTGSFQVPYDAPPSGSTNTRRVIWRIEVWGRVRRWPGFMHPYTVKVL